MSVVGIVTEYNPFHNGHKYHIEQAKAISGSDYCIAVMSGNYVQRGEPAIINKWSRTKMALENGADIVIEIPVSFATSSAEFFSISSVALLNSLGIVDSICFGSEIGNINDLDILAQELAFESLKYKLILSKYVNTGISYPVARSKALIELLSKKNVSLSNKLENVINSPNNILGIEYLKALKRMESKITPYTIKRMGAGYHDEDLKVPLASASAIRKIVKNSEDLEQLAKMMPPTSYRIFYDELILKHGPVFYNDFFHCLKYKLICSSNEDIEKFVDVSEGLENRIISSINNSDSIEELIANIRTKRYTSTKISRALLHILLDLKKDTFNEYCQHNYCQYIRVLGFKSSSQELMKKMKKNSSMPIIVNIKDSKKHLNSIQNKMLDDEIRSTNIYNTIVSSKYNVRLKNDYTHPLIII